MSTSLNVLLTGPTGHLGTAISAALLTDPNGLHLRTLVRSKAKMRQLAASDERLSGLTDTEWVVGDIRDPSCLHKALEGIDIVIHACHSHEYWKGSEYLYDVNVGGTNALVAALAHADSVRRIIYIGSYSAHRVLEAPAQDTRWYKLSARECSSLSKPIAQRILWDAAQDNGFTLNIVSPGYMIGPYQLNPTYFGAIFHAVAFGPLRWCPGNRINIVDVRDVAQAVTHQLYTEDMPTWTLATGEDISMQRLFTEINHQAGFAIKPRPIPPTLFRLMPDLKQFGRYGRQYFTKDHTTTLPSDLHNRLYDHSSSVRDSIIWARRQPLFESRWELMSWLAKRYLR